MKKNYLDKNIFYIENFLDQKSWKYINNLAQDSNGWEYKSDIVPQRISKKLDSDKDNIFWDEFEKKVNNVFYPIKYQSTLTKHISGLLQYKEGFDFNKEFSLGKHKDDYGYKKAYNINTKDQVLLYGCIYYINDDYQGGELVYPEKNVEIIPKTNMLVVHSASDEYEHAVKQVYNGTRYSIPLFYLNKII